MLVAQLVCKVCRLPRIIWQANYDLGITLLGCVIVTGRSLEVSNDGPKPNQGLSLFFKIKDYQPHRPLEAWPNLFQLNQVITDRLVRHL